MVSIRDVARTAKVSIATVSRVITNNAPVDELTRKRVEEAIAEMGYRPNINAQSLRSKSAQMIGLLVPGLGNPAFTRFIQAISHASETAGLGLMIADTRNDPNQEEKAIDMMLRRNVDGIILSRVSDKSRIVDRFIRNRKKPVPLVIVDRALPHEDVPNVVVDNYRAGYLAGQHLAEIGCRKIVCACGPLEISLVRERNAGFCDALVGNGIEFTKAMQYESDFSFESGAEMIREFGRRGIEFDGIWCHDDIIALGALTALQRRNFKIPEDVALMGMDNIQYSNMCFPTLTTIVQPYEEMSQTVISLIDQMRNGKKVSLNHIVLDVSLKLRESTAR